MALQSIYGLKAGMTYDEVKRNTISLNPQPDPVGEWFSFYPQEEDFPYKYFSCRITKKFGLTRICAWTQNIQTKNNGAELFSLFAHLRDQEQQLYGSNRLYHILKDHSQFNEDTQFTLSLLKGDRLLLAVFAPQFNSILPQGVQQLHLQAHTRDEYSGNVHKKFILENDN